MCETVAIDNCSMLFWGGFHFQGAGIIPKTLDLDIVDEVVAIHSDSAMEMVSLPLNSL